jgi:hypothetical protein
LPVSPAWSYKAKDQQILVVEDFSFETPKTKEMAVILKSLQLAGKKILLLTSKTDKGVLKSGQNIPKLNILEAAKASTYDILNNNVVLIQKSGVDVINKTFATNINGSDYGSNINTTFIDREDDGPDPQNVSTHSRSIRMQTNFHRKGR